MLQLQINSTPYTLRTNWNEVTFEGYIAIVKAKDKPVWERLALYAGIPMAELHTATLPQINLITEVLDFMDAPDVVMGFAAAYDTDPKVPEQEYWKIEKAKQLLKSVDNPLFVAAEIVELYTSDKDGNGGVKINDLPVTETIGQALFFCNVSANSSKSLGV